MKGKKKSELSLRKKTHFFHLYNLLTDQFGITEWRYNSCKRGEKFS